MSARKRANNFSKFPCAAFVTARAALETCLKPKRNSLGSCWNCWSVNHSSLLVRISLAVFMPVKWYRGVVTLSSASSTASRFATQVSKSSSLVMRSFGSSGLLIIVTAFPRRTLSVPASGCIPRPVFCDLAGNACLHHRSELVDRSVISFVLTPHSSVRFGSKVASLRKPASYAVPRLAAVANGVTDPISASRLAQPRPVSRPPPSFSVKGRRLVGRYGPLGGTCRSPAQVERRSLQNVVVRRG